MRRGHASIRPEGGFSVPGADGRTGAPPPSGPAQTSARQRPWAGPRCSWKHLSVLKVVKHPGKGGKGTIWAENETTALFLKISGEARAGAAVAAVEPGGQREECSGVSGKALVLWINRQLPL